MPTRTLYDENGQPVQVEFDEADQQPNEGGEQRTNAEWAALRRERRAKENTEKERDAAVREAAFLRAGIDPDDPKMTYFVKGYDGEVTKEAIVKAATDAGFLAGEAPPDPTADPDNAAALAASQRAAAMSIGAAPPEILDAEAKLNAAYVEGGTEKMLEVAAELGIPFAQQG